MSPDECIVFRQLRERKGGAGPAGCVEVMGDDRRLGKSVIGKHANILTPESPQTILFGSLLQPSQVEKRHILFLSIGPGGMDDDEDYNAARGATIAQAAADGALFAERLAKAWKQHKARTSMALSAE